MKIIAKTSWIILTIYDIITSLFWYWWILVRGGKL